MKNTALKKPAAELTHEGATLAEKSPYRVVDCVGCGFAHAVPIPTDAELAEFYRSHYYVARKPDYIAEQKRDEEYLSQVYAERIALFGEHLSPGGVPRILDIGSGPGFFLKACSERGWSVKGIEPSPTAAEFSRGLGLDIHNGTATGDAIARFGPYDVVYSNGVLEHVRDPADVVHHAAKALRPGGLLFAAVGNEFSELQDLVRSLTGAPRWWVVPPEHINYFTASSIRRLVESAGLEVVWESSTFPMELFVLMGLDYTKDREAGRTAHAYRKSLEMALARRPELKERVFRAFARAGVGRSALVLARK